MTEDEPGEENPFDGLGERPEDESDGDPFEGLGDETDERPDDRESDAERGGEPEEHDGTTKTTAEASGSDSTEADKRPSADGWEWGTGGGASTPETDAETRPERVTQLSERLESATPSDANGNGVEGDDPFAGLTADARDEPGDDPFESFERMEVDELDPDRVWESLTDPDEDRAEAGERRYAEVSKHSYCEQCEFFSEPPDVRCSHEGTEILDFPDVQTVRVVDCPIVAEREEIETYE